MAPRFVEKKVEEWLMEVSMVNKLVDGITRAIHYQFGQEYHIYTENKEQEMKEPCFFVSCVSTDDKRVLGNRYKLTNKFCIQYFPCSDEPKRECNTIRDALVMALEYIEVEKEAWWKEHSFRQNIRMIFDGVCQL